MPTEPLIDGVAHLCVILIETYVGIKCLYEFIPVFCDSFCDLAKYLLTFLAAPFLLAFNLLKIAYKKTRLFFCNLDLKIRSQKEEHVPKTKIIVETALSAGRFFACPTFVLALIAGGPWLYIRREAISNHLSLSASQLETLGTYSRLREQIEKAGEKCAAARVGFEKKFQCLTAEVTATGELGGIFYRCETYGFDEEERRGQWRALTAVRFEAACLGHALNDRQRSICNELNVWASQSIENDRAARPYGYEIDCISPSRELPGSARISCMGLHQAYEDFLEADAAKRRACSQRRAAVLGRFAKVGN